MLKTFGLKEIQVLALGSHGMRMAAWYFVPAIAACSGQKFWPECHNEDDLGVISVVGVEFCSRTFFKFCQMHK